MLIYDKLITEIQDQDISLVGDLYHYNHFMIKIDQKDLLKCIELVKNHQFEFLNINANYSGVKIEYYFQYPIEGRNFLLSFIIDLPKSKDRQLPSISDIYPSARYIEEFFESKFKDLFKINSGGKKILFI